jgi:hypothetical protein
MFEAVKDCGDDVTRRAALGFRMPSGWGALVAVSNDGRLEVIERRRIAVAEANVPGSKQPYHYAENLGFKQVEEYIARCSTASGQLASAAVREVLSQLKVGEYRVQGAAILTASGRTLASLEKILASHALIHTAEGEFFRSIVRLACEQAGLAVTCLRERELEECVKKTFGRQANQVTQSIARFGKRLGAPWAQDEKLASLAAILVLATGEPSVPD